MGNVERHVLQKGARVGARGVDKRTVPSHLLALCNHVIEAYTQCLVYWGQPVSQESSGKFLFIGIEK